MMHDTLSPTMNSNDKNHASIRHRMTSLQQQQQQHSLQAPFSGNNNVNDVTTTTTSSSTSTTTPIRNTNNNMPQKNVIIENKMRIRDIIAIGIAILFTKIGISNHQQHYNTTSLKATIELQWYIPRYPYIDNGNNTDNNNNINIEGNEDRRKLISMKSSTSTSMLIPNVLDIDGDGIPEAIVTVTQKKRNNNNNKIRDVVEDPWLIQVLDMKPIMKGNNNNNNNKRTTTTNNNNRLLSNNNNNNQQTNPFIGGYYRPMILFESDDITKNQLSSSLSKDNNEVENKINETTTDNMNNSNVTKLLNRLSKFMIGSQELIPLDMITAHVIIRHDYMNTKDQVVEEEEKNKSPTYNRTLQYFCGNDWHDASTKCAVHCPSGQSNDCPNGERCFADTPCTHLLPQQDKKDNTNNNNNNNNTDLYNTTTPAGGLPSIFTLWSNGYITMHSITIIPSTDLDDNSTTNTTVQQDATKRSNRKKKRKLFTLNNDNNNNDKNRLKLQLMWKSKLPLSDDDKTSDDDPNNADGSSSSSYTLSDNSYHWNDIAMSYVDSVSVNNGAGYIIIKGMTTIFPSVQKRMNMIQDVTNEVGYDVENVMPYMMRHGRSLREPIGTADFIMSLNVEDGTIGWKQIQMTMNNNNNNRLMYGSSSSLNSTQQITLNSNNDNSIVSDPLLDSIIKRGSMSMARRRSRIPGLSSSNNNDNDNRLLLNNDNTADTNNVTYEKHLNIAKVAHSNCLREYRYSILTSSVLPHYYYSEDDTKIDSLHFEHQGSSSTSSRSSSKKSRKSKKYKSKHHPSKSNHNDNSRKLNNDNTNNGIWSSLFSPFSSSSNDHKEVVKQHHELRFGKPNVIVIHDRYGIKVYSLKNGRSLCHLSLPNEVVYVDMNHDGTIDGISSIVADPDNTESILTEPDYYDSDDDDYLDKNKKSQQEKAWNDAAHSLTQDQTKWIKQLAQRLQQDTNKNTKLASSRRDLTEDNHQDNNENDEYNEEGGIKNADNTQDGSTSIKPLCHLLALSGIPAKEELFTVDLCGRKKKKKKKKYPQQKIEQEEDNNNDDEVLTSTPPLIVEPLLRTGIPSRSRDVITAISNGVVTRIRGYDGRKQWQRQITKKMLNPIESTNAIIPYSDDPALYTLNRIHVQNALLSDNDNNNDEESSSAIALGHRPILWTGEDSMVLLSASYGTVLSYISYPQSIIIPPYIIDFNGDGTSDVILTSHDAIWGYTIKVHATTSIFYRFIWGILFLFILLAFVQNQYQIQPGKRSTDL